MGKSKYCCLAISIFCFFNFSSVVADDLQQSKTSVLNEVAQTLGELGESLAKLTDGVKRQVASGNNTLDNLFVQRTKNTLTDLSIRSTQLRNNQNTMATGIRNDYFLDPRPHVWYESKTNLGIIIKSGSDTLQEWAAEHSDFAQEESYKNLLSTLSILEKLEKMEPPATDEELSALIQVNQNYRKLIDQLNAATLELNTYIKKNET